MPVDLEMFLSQTGASLFDYPSFVDNHFSYANNYKDHAFVRSFSFPRSHILIPKDPKRNAFIEKKKTFDSYKIKENSKSPRTIHGNFADNGRKKKVTFADDKGYSLVEIREIPGLPSYASTSLAHFPGDTKPMEIPDKRWKVAFEFPPWADSKLVELLEVNKVALQSVEIKKKSNEAIDGPTKVKCSNQKVDVLKAINHTTNNTEDILHGTVKVKNLAYEKNVFVRVSFDRWLSYTDVKANFLKQDKNIGKHQQYDTFSFSINIPPSSLKYEVVEFCIGFQCRDREYWDNNCGVNYRLITEVVKKNSEPVILTNKSKMSDERITLSLTENMDIFSEIDSWSNFMWNQPYW